ncbi:MAG: alpha-amylase family glycosyl hydrolase, partial [Candidatus Cryptobacteroides sp.]
MFKKFIPAVAALALVSCAGSDMNIDVNALADAEEAQVSRVEPLSWWTGMKTPLQLMVYGEGISDYTVSVVGPAAEDGTAELSKAVKVTGIHKADSPNYLFADVKVDASAAPGTYYLVFSDGDAPVFKFPYEIQARREGSAARKSFTTADLMYLIMPDRFANGDPSNDSTDDTADKLDRKALFGRHGGDLQGIINHLDYIADLGVTAIWCTPLLEDNQPEHSYHGYACTDYYHIDSRFGCNCLYKEYVAKAHEKGIKIVMDIVTNHCGSAHWWMKDLPFKDWIHQFPEYTGSNVCFSTCMDTNASAKDLDIHESGWFDTSMPDMNLDNPYVLQYFKQWAVWWIEYADLDGLRVDTYPYNEKEPMSEWCKSVRNEYPDINIVGECWTSSIPQLAYWQGDNENKDGFNSNLPSIMDFPLYDAIC